MNICRALGTYNTGITRAHVNFIGVVLKSKDIDPLKYHVQGLHIYALITKDQVSSIN